MLRGGNGVRAIAVEPARDVLAHVGAHGTSAGAFLAHGWFGWPVRLDLIGIAIAWYVYLRRPELADRAASAASAVYRVLVNKFYFDDLNEKLIAPGARLLGKGLWRFGDEVLIDGAVVNGSARTVGWIAAVARHLQSGYLYHYAFAMIIGLAAMLGWLLLAD